MKTIMKDKVRTVPMIILVVLLSAAIAVVFLG